jgi:tetratricopeptide (TPR) repeat protein
MSTHPAQSRPLARRRRWPRPTIARVGGAIALLGLGAIVLPWLMWAHQINRAAELIEQGVSWPEPRWSDAIPSVADPQPLVQAREALAAAISWRPRHAYAYRLRGQIALAEGRWDEADAAYAEARRLAPTNRLIVWEQALVYEQRQGLDWTHLGRPDGDQPPQDRGLLQLWEQAGLSMEEFIDRGEEARVNQHFDAALRWYARANMFAPRASIPWYYAGLVFAATQQNEQALRAYQQAIALQPDYRDVWQALATRADALFRQRDWAGAAEFYRQALQGPAQPTAFQFRAALAGSSVNAAPRDLLNSLGVPIHTLTATATIEGETMHWLESSNQALADGTPTGPAYANQAQCAGLWWAGAATSIVDLPAGTYTLTARVSSSAGAAARLTIDIDGQPIDSFETALDGSYNERQVGLELKGGTHVVAVRFLNNGVFNGVDNNAFIDWVRIAR